MGDIWNMDGHVEESVQLSNGVQATFACVVACSCDVLFAILMEIHACIHIHA